MSVELKVPLVGESITEVEIGQWLKSEGDTAEVDEALAMIETEKASLEVTAPVAGTLTKVLKKQGEKARVGEVIGYMERAGGDGAAPRKAAAGERSPPRAAKAIQPPREQGAKVKEREPVETREEPRQEPPQPAAGSAPPEGETPRQRAPATASRGEEIVPMSPLRRSIARRLVEARNTAAILTTFNEIDMTAVKALRQELQESFQQAHGIKLGFMSFFVKAAIEALKRVPQVNAEIRGDDIVYKPYHDIGIAVGGGKGLVVPVLRDAERLSFAQIEKGIDDFAKRAQANQLKLEELQGGTFTISNGGIYGSLLSTPLLNPPQSGILGLHAIQERPVARDGAVVIRPMMYVALSYDHRIVDGREAVTFLKHIKEHLEVPMRLVLDV